MVSAVVMATGCLVPGLANAQAQQSLAASLKVSVFPAQEQTAEQQSADEKLCYDWAVNNTGIDPLAAPDNEAAQAQAQAQQPAEQQTSRRGAGGAVRGAAAGAVIGEIANDDASQGAAVGAAVGVVGARRKAKGAEQAAQAEAKQTAEKTAEKTAAANEEQMKNFNNGFAACLEGKKYTVKY